MGLVANRAITARQRAVAARVERRVAGYAAGRPDQQDRDQRVQDAKRALRRALRARAAAEQARHDADLAAGTALRRLLAEGLSLGDAAVLVDLTPSAAKRLLRLTPPDERGEAGLCTDPVLTGALASDRTHRGHLPTTRRAAGDARAEGTN
jgi:hypothetical protein